MLSRTDNMRVVRDASACEDVTSENGAAITKDAWKELTSPKGSRKR